MTFLPNERRVIATHDRLDVKAFVEMEEGDYRVATRWTPARRAAAYRTRSGDSDVVSGGYRRAA